MQASTYKRDSVIEIENNQHEDSKDIHWLYLPFRTKCLIFRYKLCLRYFHFSTDQCYASIVEFVSVSLSLAVVICTFPFSLFFCFRIVSEYQRAIIFRLGHVRWKDWKSQFEINKKILSCSDTRIEASNLNSFKLERVELAVLVFSSYSPVSTTLGSLIYAPSPAL